MSISLLKDLNPRDRNSIVCTRVSRMWDYRGGTDDGDIRHVDLVLIDAEGTAIYAEIGAEEVETKKPLLQEGKVYTCRRFLVFKSKPSYRPVESQFMIQITVHTLIEEKQEYSSDFPLYTYTLTSFDDLPALVAETKRFVDVVGMITQVSDISTIHLANQSKPTVHRIITLRDLSNYEMKLCLWGQRAREFDADEVRAMGQDGPVIAIFVGMLMKTYKGEDSLSGNTACRWYINAEVPEIEDFFDKINGKFQPIEHVVPPEPQVPPPVINAQPEHKTLEELHPISPYEFPPQGFQCAVTISRIDPAISWCYPACNRCNRTVHADGSGYKCPHCQCTGFRFKYKICVIATDEAEFLFFGEMGQRLVWVEVGILMRSCRGSNSLPSQIAALVSQKYVLTVNVTQKCFGKRARSYQVNNINLAYGRQASIPVVKKSSLVPESSKHKALALHAGSSSEVPMKEVKQSELMIPGQAHDDTPPPKLCPILTLSKKDTPSSGSEEGSKNKKKPRKRLFKTASSIKEEHIGDEGCLDDSLEDDLNRSAHNVGAIIDGDSGVADGSQPDDSP